MISDIERQSLTVGLKQVKKALQQRKAVKVFVAEDCDDKLRDSIKELCASAGIVPVYVETMTKLGSECGIDVKASCACVCR